MSAITDMRDQYIAAEAAILTGQQFRWGERQLTRADLDMVQAGRREWERKAAVEARGGRGYVLADFSGECGRESGERWGRR